MNELNNENNNIANNIMSLPKSLRRKTPNPNTTYGQTKIGKHFREAGKRFNVYRVAEFYGSDPTDNKAEAYAYLADVMDTELQSEIEAFKTEDAKPILLTATIVQTPFKIVKGKKKNMKPKEIYKSIKTTMAKKDAILKKWIGEEMITEADYNVDGSHNTGKDIKTTPLDTGGNVMLDHNALNIDHYIPNEEWDTKRNMCVVDFIKWRYGNSKIKKKLKLNKKATEEEADLAIQYYSTHSIECEHAEELCIDQNPNKNGYTIEHIEAFCLNFNINMVALCDGEIISSGMNKIGTTNGNLAFVFQMKNNHLYPIVAPADVKKLIERAKNIITKGGKERKPKATTERAINENVFLNPTISIKEDGSKRTKLEYVLKTMVSSNLMPSYPTNMKTSNGALSNLIMDNKKYLYEKETETEEIRNYLKSIDVEYTGQSPQQLTTEFLQTFKKKSYPNPQVKKAFKDKNLKHRTHLGKTQAYSPQAYKTGRAFDINKCYKSIMNNPQEEWLIIPFRAEIKPFVKGKIPLGLYYVDTQDLTLLHGANWYSSYMVKYALQENIITIDDIKFNIIGDALKKNTLTKIIDEINVKMSDFPTLKKLVINAIYGMLCRTENKQSTIYFDENPTRMFEEYATDEAFKNNEVVIQAHDIGDRTIYTYGKKIRTELMTNNLPMAIQIQDQSNILLYKMSKDVGGTVLYRKTDCVVVANPNKNIIESDKDGGFRRCRKPNINFLKEQKYDRECKYTHDKKEWKTLNYNDSNDATEIMEDFFTNKGGLLIGRAGTGKTYCAIKGMEMCNEKKLLTQALAFTNKATINLKGSTIHHFLKIDKDGKVDKGWGATIQAKADVIFIDEISMIAEDLWILLCELKKMTNIIFILIGDYRQLPPIENTHTDWFNHTAIHYLTNNLKCELTGMKRYDIKLWEALEDVCANDFSFIEKEPYTPTIEDLINNANICYTNKTRREINKICMNHLKPDDAKFIPYQENQEDAKDQDQEEEKKDQEAKKYHQDAYVYNDMPLYMFITTEDKMLKKNEKVLVVECGDGGFSVVNDMGNMMSCSYDRFHNTFLVGYCATAYKSQGDTIKGKLNLFDNDFIMDFMNEDQAKKVIYTMMSRATALSNINICDLHDWR